MRISKDLELKELELWTEYEESQFYKGLSKSSRVKTIPNSKIKTLMLRMNIELESEYDISKVAKGN